MDIEKLAHQAHDLIDVARKQRLSYKHGFEVEEGWFTIHNDDTGQSAAVLYHEPTNMIFKEGWGYKSFRPAASRKYIGEVTIMGSTFRVRLPETYVIEVEPDEPICVQEFVQGEICPCDNGAWCDCAKAMVNATGCNDAHTGNWKIVGNEVILFDFEYISY